MKQFRKTLLTAAVAAALCVLFALAAFAVPAKPGTHESGNGACRSHAGTLVTLDSLATTEKGGAKAKAPVQPTTERSLPLLMLVVGFSNIAYHDDYDWGAEIFEGEKSLTAYYDDMSFGKFTFVPAEETAAFGVGGNTNTADRVNDGIVHLNMDIEHDDWTLDYDRFSAEYEKSMNRSLDLALSEIILAAEPYVDFAAYDRNADGEISTNELAIAIIFAGYEASSSYNYAEGRTYYLWAHAWTLKDVVDEIGEELPLPCPDGVQVDSYIAMGEQMDDNEGQTPIGTLAHELGHYLGLPDLYDTGTSGGSWSKYDVDYLSLMSSGSWGTDPDGGYCPYSLDIWSRTELGWVTPVSAHDSAAYTLCAQSYDTENEPFAAVKIPTVRETEYYLLENRQCTKWDATLCSHLAADSSDGGIILWHIDMAQYLLSEEDNVVNNADHRPAVMPLYPEKTGGVYSFIGNQTKVEIANPFFDNTVWSTKFNALGESLNLPLYGIGASVNDRAARVLSDILVHFDTDTGAQMTVSVSRGEKEHLLYAVPRLIEDCTRGGTESHWVCEVCGAWFADETAQTPVTPESLAIAPAEHRWDAGAVLQTATEYRDGLTRYTCGVCGATYDETTPHLERTDDSGDYLSSLRAFFEMIFDFIMSLFGR